MEAVKRTQEEKEKHVAEEYLSSLQDLTYNSKPLINMLTMLAEENIEYAPVIVKVLEEHIAKVQADFKLPVLYLIDSIVKNVKATYIDLFSENLVTTFCGVFEKANEKIRERMYPLRLTWSEVFPPQTLFKLDVKVKSMDNNWPITAKAPQPSSIHVNPDFLKTVAVNPKMPTDMEEILHAKTRELLELRKRKLELELEATVKQMERSSRVPTTESAVIASVQPPIIPLNIHSQAVTAPLATGVLPTRMISPQHASLPHQSIVTGPVGHPIGVQTNIYAPHSMAAPRMLSHINAPPPPQRMMTHQGFPSTAQNQGRTIKVNPVNPVMMNSIRQMRDPRIIARQQQNLITPKHAESSKADLSTKPLQQTSNKSEPAGKTGKGSGGSEIERKTISRHRSFSSEKSSGRDKERDRKRHDAKNASHVSSTSDRDRDRDLKSLKKCDKDNFEIAPLSTAFKRKSSSPSVSPTKLKESKRSSKSRTYSRSKPRSRSRSPIAKSSSKDVDLRILPITSPGEKRRKHFVASSEKDRSPGKNTAKILDKILGPVPINPIMDVDLRQIPSFDQSSTQDRNLNAKKDAPTSTKVLKGFKSSNKQDNSAGSISPNISTMEECLEEPRKAVSEKINTGADQPISKSVRDKKQERGRMTETEDDIKKRPSQINTEGPLAKKSKSSKLDALFGSEDVDLRKVILPRVVVDKKDEDKIDVARQTPPPPIISEDKLSNQLTKNPNSWDKLKTLKPSPPQKSSSLEDVRAKLAKTAKYSSKYDKIKVRSQSSKVVPETNTTEERQNESEEKIRTIVTQAQELLENNSITQEQYTTLIQTVMSINENNKLEEAKRREQIDSKKEKSANSGSDAETTIDTERSAARDAVLKKRIPKLPRATDVINDKKSSTTVKEGSPRDDRNEPSEGKNVQKSKSGKDNRHKSSKWNDRAEPSKNLNALEAGVNGGPLPENLGQPRSWGPPINSGDNRTLQFRGTVPHPPLPPLPSLNLRLPHLPWQIPQPPFVNPMPIVGANIPPPPQPPSSVCLPPIPPIAPKPCNSIDNPKADLVRTITIDGKSKEIRIYDEVAIVFMEVDQPHEITFQPGQRALIFNNQEPITLQFNDDYKLINIDGEPHRVRFGFPSRELYINENWYEIYFGGPPVTIPVNNKHHIVKAEGPPPQVHIGPRRRDLVIGKINMIIDAHIIVPLFLDAREQTFRLGENEHSIQFADNLLTVLLDGEATQIEYGGLPKSLSLGGRKYFIRFGALPQGVVAGKVQMKGMRYVKTQPEEIKPEKVEVTTTAVDLSQDNSMQVTDTKPQIVEGTSDVKTEVSPNVAEDTKPSASIVPTTALGNINIDVLFQQLVSSGVLGGTAPVTSSVVPNIKSETTELLDPTKPSAAEQLPKEDLIQPIDLEKPETIKKRQDAIVATLFAGMQCGSCGLRFPPEQTIKYSQHLDWHFRQNRRERDSTRKAHSRKWYYDLSDWIQYEEIEDLEDREKNFFESQQTDLDANEDVSNRSANSPAPTCPAGPHEVNRECDMCNEIFEQFYNEELEEWHLRSAIKVEDKFYHPLCYEDYKASLEPPKAPEENKTKETDIPGAEGDNAVDNVIKIEVDDDSSVVDKSLVEIVADDDDDDVIVLPNEEPTITEIDDDDEYVPLNVTRAEMGTIGHEDDASKTEEVKIADTTDNDVEIQEPNIPFTDLDTYEEKDLPEIDEASQMSLLNVKIKEEPKDDEDEDDGFEDVGTVLIAPDEEISIASSEGTQHITTSAPTETCASPSERPHSSVSIIQIDASESTENTTDLNISMDGNVQPGDERNLSIAGPSPAIPLASLVNKIKINITKNTVTSASNSSSSSATTTIASGSSSISSNSKEHTDQESSLSTGSTIPVLCGGGTVVSTTAISNGSNTGNPPDMLSNISSISVIGSYGSLPRTVPRSVTPPRIIEPEPKVEIKYDLKPALKNIPLKITNKVERGVETSGLCSIM